MCVYAQTWVCASGLIYLCALAAMTVRALWPKTPMQTHSQLTAHVSHVIPPRTAKFTSNISISGLVVEYIVPSM